jgi:quinol monooxygenase YgiN
MSSRVVRIVTMTFTPDKVADFLTLFDERSESIRTFPGCEALDLVRDTSSPNVMSTISIWSSEEALDEYRRSKIFLTTWEQTKTMFADRPRAATYEPLRSVRPPS